MSPVRVIFHAISALVLHLPYGRTLGIAQRSLNVAFDASQREQMSFALLISMVLPRISTNDHVAEFLGALVTNSNNLHISEVHVLLESPSDDLCDEFYSILRSMFNTAMGKTSMSKLTCVPVQRQPTGADFLKYANSTLNERFVLFSNADIVFDESLGLINADAFTTGKQGYVLSVLPPPPNGKYMKAFGGECQVPRRCTLGKFDGWDHGGQSWDAFLFRPPFAGALDLARINHTMNLLGAENRVAYELKRAGVSLSNPCLHVHAYHWHCIGGSMHAAKERIDAPPRGEALGGIMPCWDCPGVRMPRGTASTDDLCATGSIIKLTEANLTRLFRFPEHTRMCRSNASISEALFFEQWSSHSLNMCRVSTDLNCAITYGGEQTSYTY